MSGWMFLPVPAHPGSPGQRVVKRLCVCVLINQSSKISAVITTFSQFCDGTSPRRQVVDVFQQLHVVEQRDKCHEIRIRNFLTLTTASNLSVK